MFCPNCGAQIPEGSQFCANCGARMEMPPAAPGAPDVTPVTASELPDTVQENVHTTVAAAAPGAPDQPRQKPTPHIELCADGVYRWIYEYHMLKNPVILLTIIKIFLYVALGIAAVSFVVSLFNGTGSVLARLWGSIATGGIPFLILTVLTIPAYLIVAGRGGWKYVVIFEMDEQGVTHRQEPKQFTKAQGLMWLSAVAGAAAGSLSGAGAGLLAASHDTTHSDFDLVRSMKVMRRWNTIKLNQPMAKNQIYAEPEDFDFVLDYILGHISGNVKGRP